MDTSPNSHWRKDTINTLIGIRNFTTITNRKKHFQIKEEQFLSEFLGKPALCLDLKTGRDKKNQYYEGDCFAYIKVPTNQISNIHGIESLNFKLIDTNLTYEMSIKRIPKELNVSDGYSIRFAQPDDQKIGDISEKSFGFTRFHLDPLVCNKTANQIKRAWAENYFKGERGEFMVVALTDKHPVGFTQVLLRGTSS